MPKQGAKAQSFIEFALILPILLLLVMGVVELTLFIGSYINIVDLTREAARFASVRDFKALSGDKDCRSNDTSVPPDPLNFYYDTACIFSPLANSSQCQDDRFCNGFNSTIQWKSNEDDILISVFTVSSDNSTNSQGTPTPTQTVSDQWPVTNGVWVWSDEKPFDLTHTSNWRRDCNRLSTPQAATPYFTASKVDEFLQSGSTPNKGFVVVESYYCYHQVLNILVIAQIIPNPVVIHTYTIMPLPSAQPTATP